MKENGEITLFAPIMLRVRLIQPQAATRPMDTSLKVRMAPHLGLLTIAGIVEEAGHSVEVINENVAPQIPSPDVDLVGISTTVDVLPRAAEIARGYRRLGIPVVGGGIGVSTDPDYAKPLFDALCIGPAEGHWPRLLKDVEHGRLEAIYQTASDFPGEDLRAPSFRSADTSAFLYSNVIATSRGCPFACDFCYNSAVAGIGRYCHRTLASVVEEIQSKRTRHIMFIDDNFIGDLTFASELIAAMTPLRLKWSAAVSANILDHPDLLDRMRDSGCRSLFIGFESLNAASVAGVHKGQNNVSRYEALVEALHTRGIMVNASFVFGLDDDDPSVFRTTADWIIRNRIETMTAHILTPYPGTAFHKRLAAEGRITDEDLAHYDTAHVVFRPKGMTAQALYDGYLWIYNEVYSLRNIIRRLPACRAQRMPYLLFNLFYRKYGKFTERIGNLIGFSRIGRWGRRLAYRVK